jgi:hypothetical protein
VVKRKQSESHYETLDRWGDGSTIGGPITKRFDPQVKREADYQKAKREWRETLAKVQSR